MISCNMIAPPALIWGMISWVMDPLGRPPPRRESSGDQPVGARRWVAFWWGKRSAKNLRNWMILGEPGIVF